MRLHINIGSNQGDRHAHIRQAVALIAQKWPQARLLTTGPVESPPWGFSSRHAFLNIGLMLDLPHREDPESILRTLQRIERTISRVPHRNPDGSYRDRPIDIDIIDIDHMHLRTPSLTLPHPRARLRPFVMEPLRSLDPATADAILHADAR